MTMKHEHDYHRIRQDRNDDKEEPCLRGLCSETHVVAVAVSIRKESLIFVLAMS